MSSALKQINGNKSPGKGNRLVAPIKTQQTKGSSLLRNASPKSSTSYRKGDRQNSMIEKREESKLDDKNDQMHLNLQQQIEEQQINQNWFEVRLLGKFPERRGYHSSFIYERKLYIYGGHDIREGSIGNMWMIDLSKMQDLDKPEDQQERKLMWHQIDTHGPSPGAISHHSSIVFNDRMYLFGGSKSTGAENKNFYSLDLKSFRWDIIYSRGQLPEPRDEHTVCLYEGSMVMFGGFVSGIRTNKIYRYYFKDQQWEYIQPMGDQCPSARAGHTAIVYGDNMVVFGGKDEENNKLDDLWHFNFTNYSWTKVDVMGAPIARSGHSACLYGQFMLIFGGIIEVTKELDDMMIFDLKTKKWIQLFEEVMLSPIKQKYGSIVSSPQQSVRGSINTNQLNFALLSKGTREIMTAQQSHRIGQKQFINSNISNYKGDESHFLPSNQNSPHNRGKSSISHQRKISTANGSLRRPSKKRHRLASKETFLNKNQPLPHIELESPTSISMKNSFIIKNADPSFDAYYKAMMMRRKINVNQSLHVSQFAPSGFQNHPANHSSLYEDKHFYGKIQGKRPPARDGHTGLIYGDMFIIFGGDRHHMPFNDFFILDLKKEFLTKSHIFC